MKTASVLRSAIACLCLLPTSSLVPAQTLVLAATNRTLITGGFAVMPATMHHYAFSGDQETTVVMYADGPLEIHYRPRRRPRPATRAK